jgi:lectin-like protein
VQLRGLTTSSLVAFALAFASARAQAGSVYTLTQPGNWFQAEAEANSLGGHLVAINSAEEEQLLLTLFGGTEPFWIGLTDQVVEGVFVWTDGEPLTYSNWAPGEPNNENDEDYVNTNDFRGPGLWNDGHADTLPRHRRARARARTRRAGCRGAAGTGLRAQAAKRVRERYPPAGVR